MQMEIDTPQSCLPFEMKLILESAQTTVLVDLTFSPPLEHLFFESNFELIIYIYI